MIVLRYHSLASPVSGISRSGRARRDVGGGYAKHLPRHATEWTYRFNRRRRIDELADFVLRRAVDCRTITYRQLVDGLQPQGAIPVSSG